MKFQNKKTARRKLLKPAKGGVFLRKSAIRLKGQVVVEYILLLVVSVFIATVLIGFVSADKGGVLFKKWRTLLTVIAEDIST